MHRRDHDFLALHVVPWLLPDQNPDKVEKRIEAIEKELKNTKTPKE